MSVLITGGTGFIGKSLMPRLAEGDLYLLVRQGSLAKARSLLATWGLESRVTVMSGDITQKGLGLQPDDQLRLRRSVTHVYHLAAEYGPGVSAETIRDSILQGTQHLLELARGFPRLERLFYVSSTHICGRSQGLIPEDALIHVRGFHSVYERCKYLAEMLVRQGAGVPFTIFRPSMVVGDSQSGAFEKWNGPYRLIRAIHRGWLRVYPGRCRAPFHLVPVDFVADALVTIARRADNLGQTYHLCDSSPRLARFFIEETCRLLKKPVPRLVLPLSIASRIPVADLRRGSEILNQEVFFDTTNTAGALAGTGIVCALLEDYLPLMVRAYRGRSGD